MLFSYFKICFYILHFDFRMRNLFRSSEILEYWKIYILICSSRTLIPVKKYGKWRQNKQFSNGWQNWAHFKTFLMEQCLNTQSKTWQFAIAERRADMYRSSTKDRARTRCCHGERHGFSRRLEAFHGFFVLQRSCRDAHDCCRTCGFWNGSKSARKCIPPWW